MMVNLETIKLELTQQQAEALLVFLDRVEYKGFNEVAMINDIMKAFGEAKNKVQEPQL